MTDPVQGSDAVDERLAALAPDHSTGWVVVVAMAMVVVATVGTLLALLDMAGTNRALVSTHDQVLRVQVADLEAKVAERDSTIAAYKEVVQQATDGLVLMARQITEMGGTPPTVVLRPTTTSSTVPG